MTGVACVVLAGGASRRFGSDKLVHRWAGRTLLERCLDDLPADWLVVIVGPERDLAVSGSGITGATGATSGSGRRFRFVREQPPGGGPAAALVTGVRAARDEGADLVVVVPGDLPTGGRSAVALVERLHAVEATACLAVDADGRDQPLQLAVCGESLRRLADAGDRSGGRARDLLALLPATVRLPLEPALTDDIDTPEDAARWA
ncbi:molybdopterin-guanine dinucleotide biosynthesis protein A [Friedmanniella endophytica]|uniref:Molybdopterin-guanine dinucleotide biosynthesis protein A n=1 Tax=Microlunatus kandeliicorticis TaxID=1759536 RepID=A0A7W3IVT5_9ACTN|nr:NTP transferase domain-containing protein [Microlunatus kandeliicorticis]MBA8796172.1 molybdopterin-guanine dinucleotide biosynthesis protein A [Microlunatus kandeliicorticis]